MKYFANKNTLVALLSVAFATAICLPIQAQFGTGPSDFEKRLQKLEKKVNVMGKFMLDLKKSPLADMQNSQVSAFKLKHIQASSAANTISKLLGEEGFRLAFEETTNQLIVSAPAEISKAIGELLQKIDTDPGQKNENIATSQKQTIQKTLQVHTYWIADGLKDGEGRSMEFILPYSVFRALQKLGLVAPRIVAQSTSSLISNANSDDVKNSKQFGSKMSATINGRALQFESHGSLHLLEQQQIDLQMGTIISGTSHVPKHGLAKFNECEVEGSLTAPLGHYMVLGTANYVGMEVPKAEPSQEENQKIGIYPDKHGNLIELPRPQLVTSRFAFVIQVVEAASFAPKNKLREPREPKESEVDPFSDERSSKITKEPEVDPFADPIQPFK